MTKETREAKQNFWFFLKKSLRILRWKLCSAGELITLKLKNHPWWLCREGLPTNPHESVAFYSFSLHGQLFKFFFSSIYFIFIISIPLSLSLRAALHPPRQYFTTGLKQIWVHRVMMRYLSYLKGERNYSEGVCDVWYDGVCPPRSYPCQWRVLGRSDGHVETWRHLDRNCSLDCIENIHRALATRENLMYCIRETNSTSVVWGWAEMGDMRDEVVKWKLYVSFFLSPFDSLIPRPGEAIELQEIETGRLTWIFQK